jgi:2-hydroxychromene-2-carboxylate isomerase
VAFSKKILGLAVGAALSERAERLRHAWHKVRRARSARPSIEFFYEPGDPYSELTRDVLSQALEAARGNGPELRAWSVPEMDSAVDPRPELRRDYAVRDVAALRRRLELDDVTRHSAVAGSGAERRRELGHYAGGMIYFEGEWYWGVDRLAHLSERLATEGVALPVPGRRDPGERTAARDIEFFFSFRSPYSYLALERLPEIAVRRGARIMVRPVLPMVMRGLPVPREKRLYILMDSAREARRHGIPFGRACDPVGVGIERCMALWRWARQQDRELDFLRSAARGIWSELRDVASDRDLARVVERAGLSWTAARHELRNDAWRAEVEANREALEALGLWGVPSFRVGEFSAWGQDRLDWVDGWLA